MRTKIGIIVLAVACVGLVVALVATQKAATGQHKTDMSTIGEFSNELTVANVNLDDLRQANLVYSNDYAASLQAVQTLSNNLTEASGALADTKTSLQGAMDQITNLNDRITDLTAQNQVLDQRANSLSNTIETLNSQITDTQQKLSTSETNNAFLAAELQKQMAQKAELERKFNDLSEVRDQVKKLRDELFVARRLEWMREGVNSANQPKGAQLLMQRQSPPKPAGAPVAPSPQSDLNVEIGNDGSVHVIPPPTNPPPDTNPPSFLH